MKLGNLRYKILFLATLCLLGVVTFTFSVTAETQPKKPKDFGAETVEQRSTGYLNTVSPLPLDMVEERDTVAPTAPSSSNANSNLEVAAANAEKKANDDASANQTGKLQSSPEIDQEITTVLNANEVDISTLAKTFSKLAKRNYILDSNVKGKVTLHLPSAVTLDEALRLFDTLLLFKGFTAVPVAENTWKIVKAKDAKQTTIPTVDDKMTDPSDSLVTQLVRLRYIQADDMQQIVSQLISTDGSVTAFSSTNSLIIIDSALNIERIVDLLKKLDLPSTDQEITIIPILHADAKDIADKVGEILGSKDGQQKGTAPQVPAAARRAPTPPSNVAVQRAAGTTQNNSSTSAGARDLPIKIIPDDRTNSIIVVADQDLTAKVQALVEQLDSEVDRSSGRFYVYNLQHADAEEVAGILSSLITGTSAPTESTSGQNTGSSITRSSRETTKEQRLTRASNNSNNRNTQAEQAAAAARNTSQRRSVATVSSGGGAEGKVNFEGEVFIAADPSTNSLIINATRSDYLKIIEVIKELDIRRRQVLVEATILEVTLTKDEGMGIELQGTAAENKAGVLVQSQFGNLTNLLTNPSALSDFVVAAASSGTVTLPGGVTIPSQAVLVSALSRLSNVNVLSTPTILATDNEEAEIIVGENVPFVTSTSTDTSNINNTFNQIERQDVGITLRITPQISSGSFVALKIFVEISNVVQATRNDPNGPTTTIRTTDTAVEVKNGQMVVTGGLISDNVTESSRGVPFLQDIPVLGNWFRRDDTAQRRTNLMLFITPKIVANQYAAREQTRIQAGKMEEVLSQHPTQAQREDVFESPALDNVVDSLPPTTRIPTRITPAREMNTKGREIEGPGHEPQLQLKEQTNNEKLGGINLAPREEKSLSIEAPVSGSESDPIEITVTPDLPAVAIPEKKSKK